MRLAACLLAASCGAAPLAPPPASPPAVLGKSTGIPIGLAADFGAAGPGETLSSGGLARDAVGDVLERARGRFRQCHRALVRAEPRARSVRVALRLHVEPSGRVNDAKVLDATLTNAAFDACLRDVVRRLTFPASSSPSVVTHPLWFGDDPEE